MSDKRKSAALTCIETFCGAGGMALGLKEAGVDVRLAFDIDAAAVESYNQNIAQHSRLVWNTNNKICRKTLR